MSPQDDAVFERAKAHFLRSLDCVKAEKWSQAELELRQSLLLIPDRVSTLTNLSSVLLKRGKYAEAEDLVQKLLAVDPDNPEAVLNQAILLNEQKDYNNALAGCGRAIKLKPDFAEAWANRGIVLRNLGRYEEALTQYEHALALNHTLVSGVRGLLECHKNLRDHRRLFEVKNKYQTLIDQDYLASELMGYVYLDLGDKENAYACFARARIISEKISQLNNQTEWPVLASRLRHDREQLQYLEDTGRNTVSGRQSLSILKRFADTAASQPGDQDDDPLTFAIGAYHHVPDSPFSGKALGANNYEEIETSFLNGELQLVVIDNFLSEQALSNLRGFCNEATVWKRSYVDGYVGSFMGTGFCSRVILAIADELKLAMPNVIGSNALSHAWGFKYDQGMKGINLHADFARINANFWITPDEACLDKTKGGLLIYDVPAPTDWNFYSYNCDQKKIRAFLEEKNSKFVRVPYRCNRCVLFDSTYFHATDELYFKEGYTNRRINCTLLYGKGL